MTTNEKEILFIFGPSAAGKSSFIREFGSPTPVYHRRGGKIVNSPYEFRSDGFTLLIDGDDLVNWPANKDWHRQSDSDDIHASNLAMIMSEINRVAQAMFVDDEWSNLNRIAVMFNGGLKHWASLKAMYFPESQDSEYSVRAVIWIPPKADHVRNIESRKRENQELGRSWTFPENWGDADNNRKALMAHARRFKWKKIKTLTEEFPIDVSHYVRDSRKYLLHLPTGTLSDTMCVKLSFEGGVLKGWEVFSDPPKAEYWKKYYDIDNIPVIKCSKDISFITKDGNILAIWVKDQYRDHAIEVVGIGAHHMPAEVGSELDVLSSMGMNPEFSISDAIANNLFSVFRLHRKEAGLSSVDQVKGITPYSDRLPWAFMRSGNNPTFGIADMHRQIMAQHTHGDDARPRDDFQKFDSRYHS